MRSDTVPPAAAEFLYLNLEDRWPGFELEGLAVEDGRIVLAPVPAAPEAVGPPVEGEAASAWPAGVAEDETGDVWLSEPAAHRIVRIRCDGVGAPLACLAGPGTEVGRVRSPRGLAARGGAVYVADAGNDRIQVVDVATEQVIAVFGQPDPYGDPVPGADPGRFDDPWAVAIDADGFLYVLDHGNARLQKLGEDGEASAEFAAALALLDPPFVEPVCLTLGTVAGQESLLVVDRPIEADAHDRLVVLDLDGARVTVAAALDEALPRRIAALALAGDVLYAADGDAGLVVAVGIDGKPIGAAHGYSGGVAALGVDHAGRLLVHPGGGAPLVRLAPRRGRVSSGSFVGGPVRGEGDGTTWARLHAAFDGLDPSQHIRLLTYTSDDDRPPPPLPTGADPMAAEPPGDGWQSAPPEATDFLVSSRPGRFLWVAGILEGDGAGTPALRQIRVEYDPESWLRYLPAIYRRDDRSRAFLERLLALLRSALDDEEALIGGLAVLFDAWAAPDDAPDELWLEWLAGWVAAELDERWPGDKRRRAVAGAFARHGLRGTREGVRAVAELQIDAPVYVSEPAASSGIWSLEGGGSVLGFTTALASSEAQGAVLGSTAVVERSNLIEAGDYGAALFEDVAHRFCVQVYASDLGAAGAPGRLVSVLEREKPAHTVFHLCVIEPRLRVGFQARVGVDTIVSGPPADFTVGGEGVLGGERLAAGTRGQPGAVIGGGALVGRTARLGPAPAKT